MDRSRLNPVPPARSSNQDSPGKATVPPSAGGTGMGATQVDPPGFQANRSDALQPGTRLEGYVIERVIGASGFGFVYLALDPTEARRVAIKEYLPDTLAVRDEDGMQVLVRADSHIEAFERGREAFIEEAHLLARCEHPSLLHVTRSWQSKGTAYRVMPYYPGNSLLTLREAMDAPPDEASLRALLDGLLGALDTLHQAGVIHREVAPWNILLLPDDTPILLDFNAARRAMVGNRARALMSLLTPTFAPIELTDPTAERPIGPWTDIHALGAVVRYCISGEMPRATTTSASSRESMGTLVRRLQADFPKLHYSASFLTAIDAALAPNPEDRPQSVNALRKRLDDHPGRVASRGDEVFEPNESETAEEDEPELSGDEPTLGPSSATPAHAESTNEPSFFQSPTSEAAPPEAVTPEVKPSSMSSPSYEPFMSVLSATPPAASRGFDAATNDAAFAAPLAEGFAAQPEDRLAELDIAGRMRRNRRRAMVVGVLLVASAVGATAWWLDQQRDASATQSAFEQALKREVGIAPAAGAGEQKPATQVAKAPESITEQPIPAAAGGASPTGTSLPAEPTRAVNVDAAKAEAAPTSVAVAPATGERGHSAAELPAAHDATAPSPAATPAANRTPDSSPPATTRQAAVATSSAGTESASTLAHVRASTRKPAAKTARSAVPVHKTAVSNPREVCGGRTEFSLYRCMKTQCAQPQFSQHPSCKRLKERDEVS